MNEKDLRVLKTREAIEAAFRELLREKPLEKITVTELSARARINKGTFYLHYQDIYDLHSKMMSRFFDELMASIDYFPLFIEKPEEFLNRFMETTKEHFETFRLLLQKNSETMYQQQLVDKLSNRIFEACALAQNAENRIQMDAALNLLLYLTPKYGMQYPVITKSIFCDMIHAFWNKETTA